MRSAPARFKSPSVSIESESTSPPVRSRYVSAISANVVTRCACTMSQLELMPREMSHAKSDSCPKARDRIAAICPSVTCAASKSSPSVGSPRQFWPKSISQTVSPDTSKNRCSLSSTPSTSKIIFFIFLPSPPIPGRAPSNCHTPETRADPR